MERCFKFKTDSDYSIRKRYHLENMEKVKELLVNKVIELFDFKEENEKPNNGKYHITIDCNSFDYYLSSSKVTSEDLANKFTRVNSDSMAIYFEGTGEYLGQWCIPKKNGKEYKEYIKFLKEFNEFDLKKMCVPDLRWRYGLGGNLKIYTLDKDTYLMGYFGNLSNEFIEDTEEMKMSDFYLMLENRENEYKGEIK